MLSVGVLGLVGNIPLECFQNQETASGTQGGAVLFAPSSKSCRFSHPPSPCAKSTAQGVSLSADSDLEGTCPLRTCLHKKYMWIFEHNFVAGKYFSRRMQQNLPKRHLYTLVKTGSKNTSPAALSWSSLFGATVLKLFCCCTMPFVTVLAIL